MKRVLALLGWVCVGMLVASKLPAQAQDIQEFSIPDQNVTTADSLRNSQGEMAQRRIFSSVADMGKYSYVGAGWNIGLSDSDTGTADDGVAVISKVAVTKNISLRPSIIFGDDAVFNLPVTYDFNLRDKALLRTLPVTPYLGGGLVVDTGDDESVDVLVTGGVDYRFSRNWVGNVGLNVGFADEDTDLGLVFGVGYVIPHP